VSLQAFFDNFALLEDAPNGVAKLREFILQLAVEGKLVRQDSHDEPAHVLLDAIKANQLRLVIEKAMKVIEVQPLTAVRSFPFSLPNGWQWIRLGSISQKLGAGSTPLGGRNVYQDGGVKFLRSQNVWNDGLKLDGVAHISETIHQDMNGTQVEAGDILLNITGASIGRSSIVPEDLGDANVSQHVSIVRLVNKQLRFFIHLCLISPYIQNSIMQTQVGISREGLSMKNLKDFVLPVPPIEEQKRIVARVGELMRLCDELEARQQVRRESRVRLNNATLAPLNKAASLAPEEFEQASVRLSDNFTALYDSAETVGKLRSTILELAVQGKLVPQDSHDEPASVLLKAIREERDRLIQEKRIKQDKPVPPLTKAEVLFTLPEGWEWSKLDSLCYLITDGTHYTPTYIPSGVPFLSVKDVSGGRIDFSKTRFISPREHEELSKRCKPEFQDILFTKVGTTGIARVVDVKTEFSIFVSLALLKFSKDYLSPYFLELLLNSPLVKNQSERDTQGVGNKNLVLKYIKNFAVPVPPLEEQKRIVAKVNQLMKLCDELEAKLCQAEADSEKLMSAAVQHVLASINEASTGTLAGASA
jgi:type I restriction enzyme, S subunit